MFTKGDTRAGVSVNVNGRSQPARELRTRAEALKVARPHSLAFVARPRSLAFVVRVGAREQTEQREFFDGVFGLAALDASRAARSELFDGLAPRVGPDHGWMYVTTAADRRSVA